jgi:hypothetical protein
MTGQKAHLLVKEAIDCIPLSLFYRERPFVRGGPWIKEELPKKTNLSPLGTSSLDTDRLASLFHEIGLEPKFFRSRYSKIERAFVVSLPVNLFKNAIEMVWWFENMDESLPGGKDFCGIPDFVMEKESCSEEGDKLCPSG